jgi:hypothetical protein
VRDSSRPPAAIYDKIIAGVRAKGGIGEKLFNAALATKTRNLRERNLQTHSLYDKVVLAGVRRRLGLDRCRTMATGSAPIAANVLDFLRVVFGARIVEGYGQTECCGVATLTNITEQARGGNVGARLKEFLLERHPVARELLAGAMPVEGDVKWRANLPYSVERIAGDGFAIVGDAAGFIDPFYSPGMDWLSFTATRAAELVLAGFDGTAGATLADRAEEQNRDFARAYERWFDAIYRDKYDYVGDFELMSVAFQLDLSLYYIGVVSQPVKRGPSALRDPVFALPRSEIPYRLMRSYNRRLARIGRHRRERGTFGRMNHGHRFLLDGFLPDNSTGKPVLKGIVAWLGLELREGWRTWFAPEEAPRPRLTDRTVAA